MNRVFAPNEYNSIHKYHLRIWPKSGKCESCKLECKTQWSNKTGRYLRGVRSDWQELCYRCHREYDKHTLGTRFGRKRLPPRAGLKIYKLEATGRIQWGNKDELYSRLITYPWFK